MGKHGSNKRLVIMLHHRQKRATALLLAVLTATGVAGCAAPEASKPVSDVAKRADSSLPVWVVSPPSSPGMAYGVGSIEVLADPASALKRAAELARLDLVSQLRVTISGESSQDTSEFRTTGEETRVQQTLRQVARSQVPAVELDEVQIRDSDVVNGYAYALAELDRNAAASRLKSAIRDIEEQLQQYRVLAETGTGSPVLKRLRDLLPAVKLFAQREAIAEKLALVSSSHRAPLLSAEDQRLQQQIFDLIGQVRVVLVSEDAGAKAIAGNVLESLTRQGLKVSAAGDADLVFELGVENDSKVQQGTYYAFMNTRIIIRDHSGRALSSLSAQARGVSGIENIARQKAAEAVANQLSDELAKTLTERLR
jgi:hypothetical protein